MTTAVNRTSMYLSLIAVALLMTVTAPRAVASDAGKILGAVAAGYIAYELLSGSSSGHAGYTSGYHGSYGYPHQRYSPPSRYSGGGSANYWYNTGYRDGFKDGNEYGFNNGYRTGTHDGYRWGYGDGYHDGYGDGRRDGRYSPPPHR